MVSEDEPTPRKGRKVAKTEGATLPEHRGRVREAHEGIELFPRGGISETPAGLDPRPIRWVVFLAAVPLVIGYAVLMSRLVLGWNSGWHEMGLLALHATGCIAILVAYFGKSPRIGPRPPR